MNVEKVIGLFMMIPLILILTIWFKTPLFELACNSLTFQFILEIFILLSCLFCFLLGIGKLIGDKYD